MKRKAGEVVAETVNEQNKKAATAANGIQHRFGEGLFGAEALQNYADEYAKSKPYKHAVVSGLINDALLRDVRSEILENIHFTPKETDIYKIHQSGDLANLDGLPTSSLEKLPSLLQLRDALYSHDFRQWLSQVTGAGALSGKKTDMAVNVYVPGCHLLCHDDVIGTRRVSYILYLTDPENPWKPEWGGALRLYPTDEIETQNGKGFRLPRSDWSKDIPPAWNQLSFFAVQPGESFHDVEEVYKLPEGGDEKNENRIRMAISGWFHIPQEGEDGYEPGLEEKLSEKSSLQQLQGKADQLDEPQPHWIDPETSVVSNSNTGDEEDDTELSQADLEFLLKFITPNYLTPDTVEELNEMFAESSTLQLTDFLASKFADRLLEWIGQGKASSDGEPFKTSRPPHKHHYQYITAANGPFHTDSLLEDPFAAVLNGLLPSLAFHKWLSVATGLTLKQCTVLARRFRRGLDYEPAHGYEGEDPQLEYCLCVTPTKGWGGVDDALENSAQAAPTESKPKQVEQSDSQDEGNVGGYELYMAGEDDDDSGVDVTAKMKSQTGAGDRRNAKRQKADPAVYQAAGDDEDDGILLSLPASWNTLSVTLRDEGTLKFVKYVSKSAPGDRYDFVGCVKVESDDEPSDIGEDDD